MKTILVVWMAGVALGGWVLVYLAERYRATAIRALATRLGLYYLGDALPRSLTLSGTPFSRLSKVWNVVDGEPRGARIIAFDCQVGVGRGSWRRTVIAAESNVDVSSAARFEREMSIDSAGKWKLLYHPKMPLNLRGFGLMPLNELESYLKVLAGNAPKQAIRDTEL